jgi:hypothetical protein
MKTNQQKKTAEVGDDLPKNSFLRTLAELGRGSAVTEASNDLATLVKAIRKTGKPGELTIKLKVRPHADGESLTFDYAITPKVPRKSGKSTSFYDTEDGGLQRDNPNQPEMFATIEGGKGEEVTPEATAQAVNE